MARISQQAKDGLIVAVTIGVGLTTGFFVDARGKHENATVSLAALVLLGAAQLGLSLMPSQDIADLEEYRKRDMAGLRITNAYAAQALKAAEEGNLSESLKWQDAWAKRQAEEKHRGK